MAQSARPVLIPGVRCRIVGKFLPGQRGLSLHSYKAIALGSKATDMLQCACARMRKRFRGNKRMPVGASFSI